ncbi:MAG: hypothetical protein ACJ8DB_07660 [Microvirga sp.]
MQRVILLSAFLGLVATVPGWAQNQDSGSTARNGEITIPSEKALERDAVRSPRNEFSTNDATATRQMEQQNQQIDRKVIKGICTDC